MPLTDADIEEIVKTGERLPPTMFEAGLVDEPLNAVFDGEKIVDSGEEDRG